MSIAMQALQDAMASLMILGGLFAGPWLLLRGVSFVIRRWCRCR